MRPEIELVSEIWSEALSEAISAHTVCAHSWESESELLHLKILKVKVVVRAMAVVPLVVGLCL